MYISNLVLVHLLITFFAEQYWMWNWQLLCYESPEVQLPVACLFLSVPFLGFLFVRTGSAY